MVRVDLHVHSSASFDCRTDPKELVARCRQRGLAPIFVTDHNTIDGATQLRALTDQRIVVGEEVSTSQGELIGLFLNRPVRDGLPPVATVHAIKDQGGLVYLEHPYDASRRHLREDAIEEVADLIDIVEVFNGRSDEKSNRLAAELRETLGVVAGAGSDAHTLAEVGSVYVELDDFDGPNDFLEKLRRGKIVTKAAAKRGWVRGLPRRLASRGPWI